LQSFALIVDSGARLAGDLQIRQRFMQLHNLIDQRF
jgi:hypothetical protein